MHHPYFCLYTNPKPSQTHRLTIPGTDGIMQLLRESQPMRARLKKIHV